jgi:hypothetical protein
VLCTLGLFTYSITLATSTLIVAAFHFLSPSRLSLTITMAYGRGGAGNILQAKEDSKKVVEVSLIVHASQLQRSRYKTYLTPIVGRRS